MKPLSQKKRIAFMVLFVIIFIIGTPLLVLYSSGYRLGSSFSLFKTGGIFIHSDIAGTQIFVDDEFIEDNGLILRNTLIQDLNPKRSYEIRVEKEGFTQWKKEVVVFPNLVTEARVLMLPEQILAQKIPRLESERIALNAGQSASADATNTDEVTSDIALTEELDIIDDELNEEYVFVNQLFNKDFGDYETLLSTTTESIEIAPNLDLPGRFLSATTTPDEDVVKTVQSNGPVTVYFATSSVPDFISRKIDIDLSPYALTLKENRKMIAWLDEGNVYMKWIGGEDTLPFYFCIETCRDTVIVQLSDEDILDFDFYPGRNDALIIKTAKGIFAREVDNRSEPNTFPIALGSEVEFATLNNSNVYIKDKDGSIAELDL